MRFSSEYINPKKFTSVPVDLGWRPFLINDLKFYVSRNTRNGFILPDIYGLNDVEILTPVFRGVLGTNISGSGLGGSYSLENLFDGQNYTVYFKMRQITTRFGNQFVLRFGNNTGGTCGICFYDAGGDLYLYYSDGVTVGSVKMITGIDANLMPEGWVEVLITINRLSGHLICLISNETTGVNIASTDKIISTFINAPNNTTFNLDFLNRSFAYADFKKFIGVKTFAQCRDSNYTTNLQLWYPSIVDGTDVSGNNYHLLLNAVTDANYYYCQETTYHLNKGYTVYKSLVGVRDIFVPHNILGIPISRTTADMIYNYAGLGVLYYPTIEEPGNLTDHNLANSLLEFGHANWDRSDVLLWNATCRASAYYDASNPRRWHISELNQITLISFAVAGNEGKNYVRISDNSFDRRHLLTELFSYSSNKTGTDLTAIYDYTGDEEIPNTVYLANPYSDVIKITANADTICKFRFNDGTVYSKQEIWDKIDALVKLNANEDLTGTIFRFMQANADIFKTFSFSNSVTAHIVNYFNSNPNDECGGQATILWNVFDHYFYQLCHAAALPGHLINYTALAYLDVGYQRLLYKGYYLSATIDELVADAFLCDEPIKMTAYSLAWYVGLNASLIGYANADGYCVSTNIPDINVRLPKDSEFVFPVKSVNIPQRWDGTPMVHYACGIGTFATGIVGLVEMPFTLLQITGTGSVILNSVTYTLPAQEANILAVLQNPAAYFNSFEILTNTGGIQAEFLMNTRRTALWNYNNIKKGIISGDITCTSVVTANPLDTFYLHLDMGSNDSWSLTGDQKKYMGGLFKVPLFEGGMPFTALFEKATNNSSIPIKFINNTPGTLSAVKAGALVIDQCFSARLNPRVSTAVGSLSLTFVIYDGSSCYYTLDGSTPDATKILYTGPFTILATTTIKWINIRSGYADSHVNSRTITIT